MKPLRLLCFSLLVLLAACQKETITFGLHANDVFYIDHDGASMRVAVQGNTTRKTFLVIVHGGPGSSSYKYSTRKMEEIVYPECAVVYFDQRNAGASQGNKNSDYYDLSQYAIDLRDVISVLKSRYGQDISLFILSKSFGGMVATEFMTKDDNQDQIKGWLFVNATHNYRMNDSLTHEMLLRVGKEHLAAGLNAAEWDDIVAYCESIAPPFSFQQSQKLNRLGKKAQRIIEGVEPYSEQPIWDHQVTEQIPLTNYLLGRTNSLSRRLNKSLQAIDFSNKLGQITLPVLVCTSKFDFVCPSGLADDFFARISSFDKQYLYFEKSTHNLEEQDAYYNAFVKFVLEHR